MTVTPRHTTVVAELAESLDDEALWTERRVSIRGRTSIHFIDAELTKRGLLETIEVDTVDMEDEGLIDWLAEQQIKRGLKARVVDVFGPGGGNPVVEWSGPRDALEKLLREAYEADDDDVEMYLGD